MSIFKGRRATRTRAPELIALGFKAVALPESPWTVGELATLKEALIAYYLNACVTETYGNCESCTTPSVLLYHREIGSCSRVAAMHPWTGNLDGHLRNVAVLQVALLVGPGDFGINLCGVTLCSDTFRLRKPPLCALYPLRQNPSSSVMSWSVLVEFNDS
jgi:hypothetical protein